MALLKWCFKNTGRLPKHGEKRNAEFKTLVIRMLKEFGEDVSSIKRIQSETKDALIEIKNNLQGNNRREGESQE